MGEIIEPDVPVEAAIAETFERLRIANPDAETLRVPVVNCSWEGNQLMDGNLVWAKLEHELNGLVLFGQRSGQAVDPARFCAQPGFGCRSNAAANLILGHAFFRSLQNGVRSGFDAEINSLASSFAHALGNA